MKNPLKCKKCFVGLIVLIIVFFASLFLVLRQVNAQEEPVVVINEIAWMGTSASSADEWVELKNNTGKDIDISGWGIYEEAGETLVEPLEGVISADSYYLIERTDDSTVPGVEASQEPTSWGGYGLSNSGEYLVLKDTDGVIIYEVDASSGWPAGDNNTKETMEITENGTWKNGPAGGTPGAENSYLISSDSTSSDNEEEAAMPDEQEDAPSKPASEEATEEPSSTTPATENEAEEYAEVTSDNSSISTQDNAEDEIKEEKKEENSEDNYNTVEKDTEPEFIKTTDVIISEFMPNPKGVDRDFEWIEILNTGTKEYDLSGWMLDDSKNRNKPFIIPDGTIITTGSYLVFPIEETGIQLTNSGDSVRILYPDGSLLSEVAYSENAKEDYSYALLNNSWLWTDNPTPGAKNITPTKQEKEDNIKSSATVSSANTKSDEEEEDEEPKTAAVSPVADLSATATEGSGATYEILPLLAGALISLIGGFSFLAIKRNSSIAS